jgi:hypothetical protein
MWLNLFVCWAVGCVVLVVRSYCTRSGRTGEDLANAMLAKDWYWIWRHTETTVGLVSYSTHERIDAVYASQPCVAELIARSRHAVKPNQRIEPVKCMDDHDRSEARIAHKVISDLNQQFYQPPRATIATGRRES